MEQAINDNKKKKRFNFRMPGAFMILFILTVVAVIATWIIPAGAYSSTLRSYSPGGVLNALAAA
ncbi:hypothetical protein, partial [Staphylococcus capitis]|uniref:hypothetical protein n=1 Tax=Staphylococcus capitis TaxID=29388 RepID=UPI003D095117